MKSNFEDVLDNDEPSLFSSFGIHQTNLHLNEDNCLLFNNTTSSQSLDDQSHSPMIHQFSAVQWKSRRWQLPVLPRRRNSIDVIYERSWAKVQSNSYSGIRFIGRQVRIKSNSSLSQKRSAINYNNNCCESTHSEESHQSSLSTSNDSLTSFEDGTVENIDAGECTLSPINQSCRIGWVRQLVSFTKQISRLSQHDAYVF